MSEGVGGAVSADLARLAEEKFGRLWQDDLLCDWFSTRWEVRRECTIMLLGGGLLRPDRVMTQGDRAVVLDFKVGAPFLSHVKQVRRYVEVVGGMGYCDVKGYLLYLGDERLVQVV